jgi:hypothetical protein
MKYWHACSEAISALSSSLDVDNKLISLGPLSCPHPLRPLTLENGFLRYSSFYVDAQIVEKLHEFIGGKVVPIKVFEAIDSNLPNFVFE